jgi:prolipoprotein diacylglyceryltransferase
MIPYFPQPVLHLGRFEIDAFGALVVVAVLAGGRTMVLRAHRMGIPAKRCSASRIFRTSLGIRPLGGISGGFLGGLPWYCFRRLSLVETLRRLDIVAYAIPFAWMFGRLGCALAHDHRALPSTS